MISYKTSFLIGFHVSVVAGVVAAIYLSTQGRNGPAITFAILSAFTATGLALWWIVQIAKYSAETREIIKKGVDVISVMALAVYFGVGAWFAIRGESPRAPGHLSIQSKIIVWDGAPLVFGVNWLIIRYAKAAVERFPLVFGRRGLLFYFVCFLGVIFFLENLLRLSAWLQR